MSKLKVVREKLYRQMSRATNLTAGSRVSDSLCSTRLGSAAWARYRKIEWDAGECSDPQALIGLLDQASAALDEVAQITEP